VKLLADLHISPRTVSFLRSLGHDVGVSTRSCLGTRATRRSSYERFRENRVVLTQDLDFSALVAVAGMTGPSLISLRLVSSRVEVVNAILEKVLPELEADVRRGSAITVENGRTRRRRLPIE
jgi:predicted nuclease of predicted toxin-antitoxin system